MSSSPADDKRLADRLKQNDEAAWNEFRRRFDSRILYIAVRLCGDWCQPNCPGYGKNRKYVRYDLMCDTAMDAYLFVYHYILKTFADYLGECNLDTWLFPFLNTKIPGSTPRPNFYSMKSDYLRETKGRVNIPKCLQHLPKKHQALFKRLVFGDSLDAAAASAKLSLAEAETARERIAEILRKQSNENYWTYLVAPRTVGNTAISLNTGLGNGDEDENAIDISADTVDFAELVDRNALESLLRMFIRNETATNKLLLALRHDCLTLHVSPIPGENEWRPFTVKEISAMLTSLGYRDLTSERVTSLLRAIRERLARQIVSLRDEDTWIDETRVKIMLDEWGTGFKDLGNKIVEKYHAIQDKLDTLPPSNSNTPDDEGAEL